MNKLFLKSVSQELGMKEYHRTTRHLFENSQLPARGKGKGLTLDAEKFSLPEPGIEVAQIEFHVGGARLIAQQVYLLGNETTASA